MGASYNTRITGSEFSWPMVREEPGQEEREGADSPGGREGKINFKKERLGRKIKSKLFLNCVC
jgi:hypothetical protein